MPLLLLMLFASVQQLIRQASIYAQKTAPEEDLSIVGSDSGSSDAVELETGLRLLNELIIFNNYNAQNLSLLTNEKITVQQGTSQLILDNWAKLLKVRYLIGNTFIDIPFADLNTFLNQSIVNDTTAVPYTIYRQRTESGYILNYYFAVNQAYLFDIWGYKYITPFANLSDPLTNFTQFYEVYYLYELAYRIQNYYQIPHTPYVLEQRAKLINQLQNLKEKRIDVKVSATSQVGTAGLYSPEALSMLRGYKPS